MADLKTKLIDILTLEKECLISGDFAALEKVTAQKQRLEAPLRAQRGELNGGNLSQIKDMCATNERLFQASLKGLASVRERLNAIKSNQQGFTTYGGDGKVREARTRAATFERRA